MALPENTEAALRPRTNRNGDIKAALEMATLCQTIHNSDTSHIISAGLHEFIDIFQANLNLVDEAIYESYFKD
ncbi:alpha-E domain-containing protein [Asticcacaulis sp.]|uniref:alpha-E domain-containing protein n=1 Tax=Asticcacaulis sp. TaxID=1872648 RepID=UPI003F7BFF00